MSDLGTFNLSTLKPGNNGEVSMGGHIIPTANDVFDIGSAERKVRDLYVSDNSIWIGDKTKISFTGGKMKFRKRKTNVVPAAILAQAQQAGHDSAAATQAALQLAGVSTLQDMKLQDWHKYMRTLKSDAKMTDIFRDDDEDYEESSASDAWKEIGSSSIYTTSNVGLGTQNPTAKLEVNGSLPTDGILSPRFFLAAAGDNVDTYDTLDNSLGPWYGLGFDTRVNGVSSTNFYRNMTQLTGYYGVNLRTAKGNLFIDEDGKVGVNTSSPEKALHVNGSVLFGNQGPGPYASQDYKDALLILGGSHVGPETAGNYNSHGKVKLLFTGANNDYNPPYEILCEDENGYETFWLKGTETQGGADGIMYMKGKIGLGTSTPNGKLHVSGTAGGIGNTWRIRVGRSHGYGDNYQKWFIRDMGEQGAMSILASGDIVTQGLFVSHSDERLKKDVVEVEDGSSLEILRLLKPKRYKYIDAAQGTEPVWGFMAQEVAEVIPYATKKRTECIPNIYEVAKVSSYDPKVIKFTNFETTNLVNDSVMKIFDTKDDEHLIQVVDIIDKHTIRVNEDLSSWAGALDSDGNVIAGKDLFVYGTQVDDVHTLNKNAIWTVATSALQEVDRLLQIETEKLKTLETDTSAKLTDFESQVEAEQTKIKDLEATISDLKVELEVERSQKAKLEEKLTSQERRISLLETAYLSNLN